MSENECRQQWSVANVQAVATAARCALEGIRIDYEGVDAVIRQAAPHPLYDSIPIDIQLKCTSQLHLIKDDHIAWQLKKSNYDQLRSNRIYGHRILIVCTAPIDFTTWLDVSFNELTLKGCGYWVNMRGLPEVSAADPTVRVPRKNVFNTEQLLGMFHRIGTGGQP